MNVSKQGVLKTIAVLVSLSVVLCSPLSYKEEDAIEVTTTPKMYRDRFTFNMQHKTKTPPNGSLADNGDELHEMRFIERPREFENEDNSKAKSVMPGEKTMRESDGDDDDDDDGGEYEGFDYGRDDKADRKKPQQCSRQDAAVGPMPMMIMRELDMVAVQIPMKDRQGAREWSEWSACSRPCRAGRGLQSRWRAQHGVQGKEQQFRPCYLADCALHFRPSFRRERRRDA